MTRSEYFIGLMGTLLSLGFFLLDLMAPLGVAAGVPYVAVVALGLVFKSIRLIIFFALLGIVLTIAGFFLSPDGGVLWVALLNRSVAIFAIIVVALFGHLFLSRQLKLEASIRKLADTDELTGIASRRFLLAELRARVMEAHRYKHPFSLFMIDIDHFKSFNDQYGHQAGDMVLQLVTKVCASSIRQVDTIGRYGGEEFLVICPSTEITEAHHLAERMRDAVEMMQMPGVYSGLNITISIGVAAVEDWTESYADLIGLADEALYEAKKSGRNRVIVMHPHGMASKPPPLVS